MSTRCVALLVIAALPGAANVVFFDGSTLVPDPAIHIPPPHWPQRTSPQLWIRSRMRLYLPIHGSFFHQAFGQVMVGTSTNTCNS
jgi:prepilin-type processing-associated H-X9-DG protein